MNIESFKDIQIGYKVINKKTGFVGNVFGLQYCLINNTSVIGCCVKSISRGFKWIKYSNENIEDYKIMDAKIDFRGKKIK